MSTALNSNTLNIALGLLLPAAVIGLGQPAGQTTLIAVWYLGLTAAMLAFAYRDRGVSRETGILVIAAYLVFAGSLFVPAQAPGGPQIVIAECSEWCLGALAARCLGVISSVGHLWATPGSPPSLREGRRSGGSAPAIDQRSSHGSHSAN